MPALRINYRKANNELDSIEFDSLNDVTESKASAFYKAYQKLTNNTLVSAQKRNDYEDVDIDD